MSYLRQPVIDDKDVPALGEIQAEFGFVPNFYRAQVMRPDLIAAEAGLIGSVIVAEGALTRQEKEYLFLVCSAANLSTYCVTIHCELIRMLKLEGPAPEEIAVDHVSADIPMRMKALLNFGLKLNNQAPRIGAADIEALRTYGYSEQQIMEAVVCVGAAKFSNVVSLGLGTAPDFDTRNIRLPGMPGVAAGSAR